jgi:hypothetical protein
MRNEVHHKFMYQIIMDSRSQGKNSAWAPNDKKDLTRVPMFGKSIPFINDATYSRWRVMHRNKWVCTQGVKSGIWGIMRNARWNKYISYMLGYENTCLRRRTANHDIEIRKKIDSNLQNQLKTILELVHWVKK